MCLYSGSGFGDGVNRQIPCIGNERGDLHLALLRSRPCNDLQGGTPFPRFRTATLQLQLFAPDRGLTSDVLTRGFSTTVTRRSRLRLRSGASRGTIFRVLVHAPRLIRRRRPLCATQSPRTLSTHHANPPIHDGSRAHPPATASLEHEQIRVERRANASQVGWTPASLNPGGPDDLGRASARG